MARVDGGDGSGGGAGGTVIINVTNVNGSAGIEAAAILMRFRVILFGACFLRVIFVGTITGNRMTARCLFHGSFGIHINIWSF